MASADTVTAVTLPAAAGGRTSAFLRRLAGKLGSLLLTLWIVTLLVFFCRFLVPGDPVRFLLRGRRPNPEAIKAITEQYGLNLPPWQQYVNWVTGMLHGDFGWSLQYRQPVSTVIASRMPTTVMLVGMAAVLIIVLGLLAGILAANKRGKPADRITLIALTILSAIPSFVGSIVLIAIFAVELGWFPSFGAGEGFFDMIYHLTLPAIALTIVFVVVVGKVTRSAMVEQYGREHVEVARSRGLSRGAVVRRHVFRNSLRPIVTVGGPLIAGLLVATSIVETAFGISGIGNLLVQSVDRLDFPVVQAIVLLVVTAFLVVNAIIDILEPLIDPRSAAGASAR